MTMRKIFLAGFLFLLISSPALAQAQGFVPCGYDINGDGVFDPKTEGCTPCHFFEMINGIIRFAMFQIVPIVATLMLIIGGALFFLAGAKPETVNQAKGIITSVIVGLLIIFAAWVIINTVFGKLNVINMPSGWKWYEISYEISCR